MERAYVQSKAGQFITASAWTAWDGLRQLGYQAVPFDASELEGLALTAATVVYGYVSVVHRALERVGAQTQALSTTPPALARFLERRTWQTTLGAVRQSSAEVFIKPLRDDKAFAGHVRSGRLADAQVTAQLPDDLEILASEVVTLVSEWRLFVLEGRCIGARPYRGDHRAPQPNLALVESVIAAFVDAPIAYAVDLGLVDDGRTILVEVNDAYSLNAYGLPSVPYAQMIAARWQQLAGAA
jgi:hypothetical protein